MKNAEHNEHSRLEALHELDVMDTQSEPQLDAIVQAAALVCEVPISLISLLDADRQWFKANVGLTHVNQTDRQVAFCNYTIQQDEVFEVVDANKDARFSNNPLVTGDPGIRFYAGAPLTLSNGARVGSLCVIDRQPRKLTSHQRQILANLAQVTAQVLQSRRITSELIDSEARFRALSAAAPLGVFATNELGAITYTNAQWQSIYGLDESAALGNGWITAIHPADRARMLDEWTLTISNETSSDTEFRIERPDGYIIFARALSQPTRNDFGDVTGHVGSVEDITLRRTQEQAIRKSEQLMKHTGSLADVGGWGLDIDTSELMWTEQTCRIHGVPIDYQPTLSDAIGFYAEESRSVIEAAVQSSIEQGQSWDLELPLIRANGERIWVHALCRVEFEEGKPVRLLGAFQNVTQKVNQRRAVENAHERMKLATDSGDIGIWDWDIEHDQLSWTPLMYQLYGMQQTDEPLTYNDWRDRLHPDDRIRAETALKKSILNKADFDDEFRIVLANGEIRHLRGTARVTRDQNGMAQRMVGVNWDVTPMRALTAELAEQHALLHVTLRSIGDAVITTDARGIVTWLNPAAEKMTGWPVDLATDLPVTQVFDILRADTRETAVSPIITCLERDRIVELVDNTILISRDGREFGIEDSAAPIRNEQGKVLGAVLVFHDVTEQRRLSNEMTYRATHDALTGLYNRTEFEQRLKSSLVQSETSDSDNAMFLVDLDQFKLVNDACGHAVGDQLLQQIAKLLVDCVREGDSVARLGGDEFGVLLEHCDIESAKRIAQELCNRMDEFRFEHDLRRFRIGTSIGLVPLDNRWKDVSDAVQAADVACYAAKDAGRNRVHVWFDSDENINNRTADMKWATRLERAIDDDQFLLYSQKIDCLSKTDGGVHAEVLLRMYDDDRNLKLPGIFLSAAERFHLATRIDRWVLQHALERLLRLPDVSSVSMLCINLSGQSVGDRKFHRYAIKLLTNAGTDICSRICIEITETSVVTNMANAGLFIDELHELGIRVALDDFGAGASSFGYLKLLNVDILKIDGQFIQNTQHDSLDAAAVRCFVDIARVQGLQTVAEYVINAEVFEHVKGMGIDFAQGFYLHQPEPIDQLLNRECFKQDERTSNHVHS